MHEHGIGRELWKVIEEQAKQNNLMKITKISIVVGKASGIEKELIVHTMKDHIIPGTFANSAELEFINEDAGAIWENYSKWTGYIDNLGARNKIEIIKNPDIRSAKSPHYFIKKL